MTTADTRLTRPARTDDRVGGVGLLAAPLGRRAELVVLGVLALTFLVLARTFQYTGDDWAWGSSIGTDRLATWFADYNGRYAGNLAVLALTRSSVLVAVTTALTVAGIVLLVLELARFRTLAGYALVYALVLSVPVEVWRQGIVWTSGFSNYALGTLTMLGVLVALRTCLEGTHRWRRPVPTAVGLFVLTFVGQLFIEHVTLFVLAAAGLSLVVALRRRQTSAPLWGVVAGAVLGAVAMFSNGAYRRALAGNGYQKIDSGSGGRLHQMLVAVDTAIAPYGVVLNTALNVVLLALVALVAVAGLRRADGARRTVLAVVSVGAALAATGALVLVPHTVRAAVAVGPVAPVALAVALVAAAVVSDRAGRTVLIGTLVAFVLLVLPLLVVTPLGPRCFVPSYAVLLVAVAVLARQVVEGLGVWSALGLVVVALALGVSAYAVRYEVYSDLARASSERLDAVRAAVEQGRSTVTLQRLPDGSLWLHVPDPAAEPWGTRYKLFNHLPASLRITVR